MSDRAASAWGGCPQQRLQPFLLPPTPPRCLSGNPRVKADTSPLTPSPTYQGDKFPLWPLKSFRNELQVIFNNKRTNVQPAVCVCEGAGHREGVWTGSGAWLQAVCATCARRTAEDLGPQPSVSGIQGDVPSPHCCQGGRRDLPLEGISASGAPFLIWCFASQPPTASGCQRPPPSPNPPPPSS